MSSLLTICLTVYNGEKYLPTCLSSIFKQTLADWQLFILDNNSHDNSWEVMQMLANNQDKVVLEKSHNNLGFVGGYNYLAKQAASKYVMLLNQDTVLEANYISKLVSFLEANPETGAAAGKILRLNLSLAEKLTNGNKISIIDTAGLRLSKNFRVTDIGSGQKDKGQYNAKKEVFGVSGALPIYRREALAQAGYFDKMFFMYKEDVDLAFRLQNVGWQSFRVGAAVAYHDRSATGDEDVNDVEVTVNRRQKSALENYLSYRNHWYVLIKNVALVDWLYYGIFIFHYELKKIIYLLFKERKTLYAWVEIFGKLPKLIKKRKEVKPKSMRSWIN